MKSRTLLTAVQWHSGMKSWTLLNSCSMAQRDESWTLLNAVQWHSGWKWLYLMFNSIAEWKVEHYLQLFNGTAGWEVELCLPQFNSTAECKVELYLRRFNVTARWKLLLYLPMFNVAAGWKFYFTYRCPMAQRDESLTLLTAVQWHSGMKSWTLLTAVQ